MSAFIYGQMAQASAERRQQLKIFKSTGKGSPPAKQSAQDKIANSIAGLIPADVLTVYALAFQLFTKTDDNGVTTISDMTSMHVVLPVLLVLTALLFLIGRGISRWGLVDWAKFAIPIVAIIAWTALLGTSALTPWIVDLRLSQPLVVLLAAAVGVLLLALNTKLVDKG